MSVAHKISQELKKCASSQKALVLAGFFKTKKGEYAQGDRFIGVTVPNQRRVAQMYCAQCSFFDIEKLITSPIHEERLTALLILVEQYKKSSLREQKDIVSFYLSHTTWINNWDLVDLSADKIVGVYMTAQPDRKSVV